MTAEERKAALLEGLAALWDRVESGETVSLLIVEELKDSFELRAPAKVENVRALGMLDLAASIIRNSMEHGE